MKENVLEKGKVVAEKTAVTYAKVEDTTTTAEPVKETVNKAIVKKDVTKSMAAETKKAVAKEVTEEKKAASKKAAAPKKEVAKKETVKKETAKKETVKKAKVGRKEIFVQYGNREIGAEEIQKRIEAAYAAEGHVLKAEDDVKVYIKPEENMMYYVVNEDYASGINLFD